MQEEITAVEEIGVMAAAAGPADGADEVEELLAADITRLWTRHTEVKCTAKSTKYEIRQIREELGERLYELKRVLATPGRAGRWSAFLKEQRLPRTTADRLIDKYERANGLGENNCTSGAISGGAAAKELVLKHIIAKLEPVLTGDQSAVCDFVQALANACGVPCKQTADGVLVYRWAAPRNEPVMP